MEERPLEADIMTVLLEPLIANWWAATVVSKSLIRMLFGIFSEGRCSRPEALAIKIIPTISKRFTQSFRIKISASKLDILSIFNFKLIKGFIQRSYEEPLQGF